MKILTLFLMLMGMAFAVDSRFTGDTIGRTDLQKMAPFQASLMIESGKAVLIDVRERSEVEGGMAYPAKWIPLSAIQQNSIAFREFLKNVPQDQTLIFYCGSGKRAEQARLILQERGYQSLNIGSYESWRKAGLPVRTGP